MNNVEYIVGDAPILAQMPQISAWKPFDVRAIDFCGKLSQSLIQAKNYADYPDLVTLAFWLRHNNVKKIAAQYADMRNSLGRGLIFHIAPGNTALAFAYSLITGLLTGNTNIIRLPSRSFAQGQLFCDVLNNLLHSESEIATRICLIKYPHDKEITDQFSAMCQTRIIWGGDNTINTIRQSPLKPRATEITFANRFSVCVINADKYLAEYEPKKTAHNFYIDTYLTDQNACSSPRIVFWLGEKIDEAKEIFWSALYDEITEYEIAPVTTVDRMLNFCKYAANHKCLLTMQNDCRIMRVQVDNVNTDILNNIGHSGFFYECDITNIEDILPLCLWELQTISYIGIDGGDISRMILDNAPQGVDRIVPTGRTMDFSLVWDGRDVVREMTRVVASG